MTVRDWIANRKPPAPPALMQQILRLLGNDANQQAGRTSDVCLAVAARSLESLLDGKRFGRESAFELLAVDGLTTYAFEYASQTATSLTQLEALANQGTQLFARIAERV